MRSRAGFTIAELALVMIVIMILASIAIPMGMRALRETKETKLVATLRELHTAIGAFTTDCGGYPEKLTDVLTSTPPATCRSTLDGSQMAVDPADFRGPYLVPADGLMPKDPISGQRQWTYLPTEGRVRSMHPGSTLDGVPYSEL
jgi:Tfp pilus assembly protein PilE